MSEPPKKEEKKGSKLVAISIGTLFVVLFIFYMSAMVPIGINGAADGTGQTATASSRWGGEISRFADGLQDIVHGGNDVFKVVMRVVVFLAIVFVIGAAAWDIYFKKKDAGGGAHPPAGH